MSGPKTASWEVEYNRELDRRARRDACHRALEARRSLEALVLGARSRSDIDGNDVPSVPEPISESSALAAIEKYERGVREQIQKFSRALDLAVARADTRELFRRAIAHAAGSSTESTERHTPEIPRASHHKATSLDPQRVARRVQHLLERIPPGASRSVRDHARELAQSIAQSSEPARTEALIAALNVEVEEAHQSVNALAREAEHAQVLIKTLDGLEGEQVSNLRAVLNRILAGELPLPSSLPSKVTEVANSAKRDADRKYAGAVLAGALTELGYDVQQGFETLLVEDGVAVCERPTRDGYAIRMRLADDRPLMDFEVVRLAAAGTRASHEQAVRDVEVEHEFCKDYDVLLKSAAKAGVGIRTVRRLAPGERPVPVLERSDRRARGSAGRARPAAKAASRNSLE